ncbi:MAG TPA: PrsW family glutamic-type intramembrane protease [Anaerolineales bacterium]|jgi:hypothetical protein|nr:PrsW family glutamic-type intramembrane protease [Anaerolineales bacterium]
MAAPRRLDPWDVLLLLLALSGVGVSLVLSLGLAGMAAFTALQGAAVEAFFPVWASGAFGALGLIGLPAVYWATRGLLGGKPPDRHRPRPVWILGVALFPVSLALGYLAFETKALPQGFGLVAHLLAAGAPVLVAAAVGLQLGPEISIRRGWGHFLAGLWAVPPVSLGLELLALVPVILLLLVGLSISPDGRALLDLLSASPLTDPADLRQVLGHFVTQPWLIVLVVGYLSLLVPMLEEGLKTMSIWPLLRRGLSPAQAFLGGLLGGTGYALFESLFLPQPGGDWAATMLARGGTPLIHGLCTAMASWGLSQAVNQRRWGRLLGAYAAAVALHGSWNLGAVALGLSPLLPTAEIQGIGLGVARAVGLVSGATLIGLSLLALFGVIHLLRKFVAQERAAEAG